MLSTLQVDHFRKQGFVLVPNPLDPDALLDVDRKQRAVEPGWEQATLPEHFNRAACQFFMVGEPLLRMVEDPALMAAARELLETDDIRVGACGLGDASRIVSADGRLMQQVQWHADGSPDTKQVSFRTALDRHDPTNAPLRVLPGTHRRPRAQVDEELRQLEIATGQHDEPPAMYFAKHPHEVEIRLDPRWTLVWTPSCWHATGVKTAAGPRRAISWNYVPVGGRMRDRDAIKHLFPNDWQTWSDTRRALWGLADE